MHFDRGTIQAHGFDVNGQDLFRLEAGENPIQNADLAPAIHPRVDLVPVSKYNKKSPPFTAVFSNIQNGIDDLKITQANVSSLARQTVFNTAVLGFGKFHRHIMQESWLSVN